jgi:hypothetical protein
MIEPSYDLQAAVFTALNSATGLTGRVYHRVPAGAVMPYLEIGSDQVFGAQDLGGEFFECNVEVSAFATGLPALKQMVSTVYGALNTFLPMNNFNTVEHHYEGTRYRTETYGDSDQVEHAIISFRYMVERQAT